MKPFPRLAASVVAVGLALVLSMAASAGGDKPKQPKPPKPPKTQPQNLKVPAPPSHPLLYPPTKPGRPPSATYQATIDKHVKAESKRHEEAHEAAQAENEKRKEAALAAEKQLEEARRNARTAEEKAALGEQEKRVEEARERARQAEQHEEAIEAAHRRLLEAHREVSEEQGHWIQSHPDQAGAAIAGDLHWVRLLLEAADHDYEGHRHRAVDQISKAITLLDPENHFTDKDHNIDPWTQKVSDTMLRRALDKLASDAAFTSHLPPGDDPQKAHEEIVRAMHQLEIALNVR
jgi:hypothetical protein